MNDYVKILALGFVVSMSNLHSQDKEDDLKERALACLQYQQEELVSGIYIVPRMKGDFLGNDPFDPKGAVALAAPFIGYFHGDDIGAFYDKLARDITNYGHWDRGCEYMILSGGSGDGLGCEIECTLLDDSMLVRFRFKDGLTIDLQYDQDTLAWVKKRMIACKVEPKGKPIK